MQNRQQFLTKLFMTVGLFLIFNACSSSNNSADPNGNTGTTLEAETAKAVFGVPQKVYQDNRDYVSLSAEAVYGASLLSGSGNVVITGTLNQAPGGNNFTYTATPNDRLVVNLADGRRYELMVNNINGNFNGTAEDFLSGNHNLAFRLTGPDGLDLQITSQLTNGNRQASITGTFPYNGVPYTIDVNVTGTYTFNVDNTGSELRIDDVYRGTINGPDYVLTLDEGWFYNSVYSSSARVLAEKTSRNFNNTWTIGENTYQYVNGNIQSAFRDGKPNEWQPNTPPWNASGTLMQNGANIGNLEIGEENGHIKIWLNLPGERVETQSWRL